MGAYITFETTEKKAEEFNKLFEKKFNGESFFHTREEIQAEVDKIQNDPNSNLKHLKDEIKTVEDWNKVLPIAKIGYAQIKVSGFGDEEENDLREMIEFALEHKDYFESIKNVYYARERFDIDVEGDNIINGKAVFDDPPLTFEDLPTANNKLYDALVEHDRPDMWKSFLDFKEKPNMETWDNLRCKNIPWGGGTVWQLMEKEAKERDGKDFEFSGRYQQTYPSFMEVNKAVVESMEEAKQKEEEQVLPGM
ncbi:MAG: hypothetical protein ACOCP4_03345 [Candidatus Woesearchaeota archaeon]